jgi:hypothetical protein
MLAALTAEWRNLTTVMDQLLDVSSTEGESHESY